MKNAEDGPALDAIQHQSREIWQWKALGSEPIAGKGM